MSVKVQHRVGMGCVSKQLVMQTSGLQPYVLFCSPYSPMQTKSLHTPCILMGGLAKEEFKTAERRKRCWPKKENKALGGSFWLDLGLILQCLHLCSQHSFKAQKPFTEQRRGALSQPGVLWDAANDTGRRAAEKSWVTPSTMNNETAGDPVGNTCLFGYLCAKYIAVMAQREEKRLLLYGIRTYLPGLL